MKPDTYIVIPNFNGKDIIGKCLDSLLSQTLPVHIIVVDNGSSDGSVEYLEQHYPQAELIKLPRNTGFTGGVNAGIKKATEDKAEYVLLFNSDAVADKNWAKELVEAAKDHDDAGIVTCKFMRSDKKHIDSTGDFYTTWGLPFPRGRNTVDKGQYDKGEYVFGATGGASLYKPACLEDIGLFDKDFFLYFEDVDISFRAQLAGWKVYYQPKAIAYHEVGATSSKMGSIARRYSIQNFILTYTKNMPGYLYIKYYPLFLTQLIRMKLGAIRDHQLGAYIKGFFAAINLLPTAIKQRCHIQKNRKVKVSDVDKLLFHGHPKKAKQL